MAASPLDLFLGRYRELQQHWNTGDQLIQELLVYCERIETSFRSETARLSQKLEDANLDLDDSRRSRRELQQQLTLATQRMGQVTADCESMKSRNPYIMVLIDGDGMIFNETFIRQGIEGGKQAAAALRSAVLDYCSDYTDEIEIMAKVCANISGLSKALRRDGCLENEADFKDFTLGFTQGKASFDFVDVGHGKERADSKIKECMRWHLRNHNCKQILLGISHDAGYAPFLDEVVKATDRDRITIIEGPPTVREITATGLRILNFNPIFRSEKLVDKTTNANFSINPVGPSTWASVSAISPPSTSPNPVKATTIPVSNGKKTPAPPKPAWNPGARGLDAHLSVNAAVLEKIKRRPISEKLCNNHYLRGPCTKGDECCFEHDYKASEEELKAISYLTRLNPCLNGQDCEVSGCIYGHHCPNVTKVNGEWVCSGFGCRFSKEEHPQGCVIKNPRKERWEERY